jgi:hypothetical protein
LQRTTDVVRAGGDLLDEGNAERGGLPGAGLAPDDQILAREDGLEHRGLDRRRRLVALLGDGAAEVLGEG